MSTSSVVRTLALAAVVAGAPVSAAWAQPAAQDAASVLLGKPYSGPAAPTPRGKDGRPDFTGFWKLLHEDSKPDGNLGKDQPGFALPYTERGRAALAANQKVVDPEARCIILGLPRLSTSVLPFEILQTGETLGVFYQLSWHRLVPLDGRKIEDDPEPHYFGNSSGRWEGDTLVIETHGFADSADGRVWLDDNANPISAQAKVVERWTRPDAQHLNLELTYADGVYYSRPISYRRSFVAGEPGEGLREFACEWNTWWVTHKLESGPGPIGPNGNRGFGPNNQIVPDLPLGAVEGSRGVGYWLYRSNRAKPSDLPPPPKQAGAR